MWCPCKRHHHVPVYFKSITNDFYQNDSYDCSVAPTPNVQVWFCLGTKTAWLSSGKTMLTVGRKWMRPVVSHVKIPDFIYPTIYLDLLPKRIFQLCDNITLRLLLRVKTCTTTKRSFSGKCKHRLHLAFKQMTNVVFFWWRQCHVPHLS